MLMSERGQSMREITVVTEGINPITPSLTFMAQKVLDRAKAGLGSTRSLAELGPKEATVWRFVITQYPVLGRAPSPQEIALALGFGRDAEVQAILERLQKLDALCLTPDSRQIQCAYPFSTAPTNHVVRFVDWPEAKAAYAMCAVDALGIPFLFQRDVEITSSCPYCARPFAIKVCNLQIVERDPVETVVWVAETRTECAATSICPTLNFFCSPGHVEAWRKTAVKETGVVLNLGEALFVAKGLFGDLVSPVMNQHMVPTERDAASHVSESSMTAVASTGGLLAAFLASLCCVGPLVLATLGVGVGATGLLASTAGALKGLLPYRPVFIGLTALLLVVALYQTYRKPQSTCTPGATCVPASSQRKALVVLWAVAALALALILAPYWLGL